MTVAWAPRILTLLVWAFVAWSCTYWVLRVQGTPAAPVPVPVAQTAPVAAEPAGAARLFGPAIEPRPAASAPAPVVVAVDPASRFQLTGVVADRTRRGVALLSVEGQPARPYRVGARIADAFTLHSVTARSAVLVDRTGTRITVPLVEPGAATAATAAGSTSTPGNAAGPPRSAAPPMRPALPVPGLAPIPGASAARRSA